MAARRERSAEVNALPAPGSRSKGDYVRALDLARANPGQWVKVLGHDGKDIELSQSVPTRINDGDYSIDPAEVEVTSRSAGCRQGFCHVYLRTRT